MAGINLNIPRRAAVSQRRQWTAALSLFKPVLIAALKTVYKRQAVVDQQERYS